MKYKRVSLDLVDKSTGEILSMEQLIKGAGEDDIHEIAQKFLIAKEIFTEVNNLFRVVEAQFLNKMSQGNATKYKNDDATIKISPNAEYEYDTELVDELKNYLNEEDFNKTFTKRYKVNRTELKALRTLGGNVKEIIEQMETKIERKPSITVERK